MVGHQWEQVSVLKLAMTLLVRDEVDIVEQNISFHLSQGVDEVVVVDNGSVDGTRDVLADLARHAPIYIFDEPTHNFAQSEWVTKAALFARDHLGADWILNNDADEFWVPRRGRIKDRLRKSLASNLSCTRLNMITSCEQLSVGAGMSGLTFRVAQPIERRALSDIYADPLPAPYFYMDLPHKVLVRASGLKLVGQGNHAAQHDHNTFVQNGHVDIFHFPIRSRSQFERKIIQGGQAYAANPNFDENVGWHWRRWHRLCTTKGLDAALADALPSEKRLRADIESGVVRADASFQTAFSNSLSKTA